jgi:DNA polymerase delta subunit 1
MWTQPDKYDKMDTKGLETVRRDIALVREGYQTSGQILVDRKDVKGFASTLSISNRRHLQNKVVRSW